MSTDRDSSIKIKKKLCENLETPLGVNKKQPRFSWLLDGDKRGTYQTAYQILVSSNVAKLENGIGDMWDSGKIESDKSINIKYKGQGLKRGTRYWWQVKCRDNKCRWSVDSDSSWFEMGLLEESEWTGTWIGAGENDNISAPLLRKRFTLEKKVDRARLYLSGLGYYELYLNGKSVGERLLDPSWTDYGLREMKDLIYPISDEMSHRVMYVTYDVTKFLQSGANIIGVMLGNGWYNQKERTTEGKLWYGLPRLLLQLNLKFKDGSRMEVGSDKTWKLASGPITFNNIYYGEVYDARREKEGWSEKNFDTSGWKRVSQKEAPGGKLVSQLSPPDRKTKKFQPESIYKPDKHTIIYDLGQNISGWVKIKVKGPEGNRVKLKFAEKLTENNHLDFDSTGGQDQIQKDVYILKGSGWEIYEPHFTWHGFRYVEITGEPELPEIDNIEGILVHTDVEQIGEFECSQPTFNKIFALYKWSQLTNLHGGVPSDCPHRERLGYTGDGQLTAESAIYCFDMVNFYRKWIDDIADSQGEESGHVQHTAPFYGGGGGPGAWGCAYILMPWYLYLYFGDTEILEKHYLGMRKWMDYLKSRTEDGYIVVKEEEGGWCLGDWCCPDETEIPPELVNTFYFAYSAEIMSRIASILDKEDDEKRYLQLKESIEDSFNKSFLKEEKGCYWKGRQGSNAYPLFLKCVPESFVEEVKNNLYRNIEDNNFHLDTGITGTPILFDVLAKKGMIDTACKILLQKTYPGYGYMIYNNATTLWEHWDGGGSHNHPMFGSIISWFFKYLAGIKVDRNNPGFKNIIIKPLIPEAIDWVDGYTKSYYGKIKVEWIKKDNQLIINIEIPVNTTAEVFIPEGKKIYEGERLIFDEGKLSIDNFTGIFNGEIGSDRIIFNIGSGFYKFIVLEWQRKGLKI